MFVILKKFDHIDARSQCYIIFFVSTSLKIKWTKLERLSLKSCCTTFTSSAAILSQMKSQNRLECLTLAKAIQHSLIIELQGRLEPALVEHPSCAPLLEISPVTPILDQVGKACQGQTRQLILLLSQWKRIDIRGHCYKNFQVRNLQMFVISWSVCPWQAVPA